MENVFITGDLVYLRYPDIHKDVIDGRWAEWFNDDSITKYLYHGVFPNTKDKQVEIVKSNLDKSDMVLLSIVEKQSDKLIGIVSLKDIDLLNRVAEITIVMGNEKYIAGAPFEAMALMTKHGFEKLNLNKIQAGQHVGLWKWINTLELIGYRLEGFIKSTHIRFGQISDSVRVGIDSKTYFDLLQQRDGNYLTDDINSLLKTRRKDNMCEKLKSLVNGLYE
ncbi:MAG: GNAT family protein [Arcobacter sp.]|uniref:GNAT family N-acetyltransferase n=1 Tax=Arcobacter sp. TaxID=1872629 RepID=UPI003C752D96